MHKAPSPLRRESPRRSFAPSARLASLGVMLALVIAAMGSLREPETVARLGQVFGLNHAAPQDEASGDSRAAAAPAANLNAAPAVILNEAWDDVKDNAPFLDDETEAWFQLIGAVQGQSPEQLAKESVGGATYAQLRGQPDLYRGRVVTLRGTIQQAVEKRAPANDLGVERYYQLGLAPVGGGEWPLLVYALELPAGFPTGENLREPATIHAAFFKNWAYSYGDGVGLAPVSVTSTFAWTPHATTSNKDKSDTAVEPHSSPWLAAGLAGIVAAVWIAWIARRTRRPPRSTTAATLPGAESIDTVDVRDQLARLAAEDEQA
ncbi:MAG: hypothetical protein KDA44_13210 [Planctomycetales bacterium]|nr:hypothetical protein [Planctomycetales bacterium]